MRVDARARRTEGARRTLAALAPITTAGEWRMGKKGGRRRRKHSSEIRAEDERGMFSRPDDLEALLVKFIPLSLAPSPSYSLRGPQGTISVEDDADISPLMCFSLSPDASILIERSARFAFGLCA